MFPFLYLLLFIFLGPSNWCILKQNCEQMEINHLFANEHTYSKIIIPIIIILRAV
jgi:hypothetical protein